MRRKRDVLGRLYAEYHEANERHFAGLLPTLAIYVRSIQRKGDIHIAGAMVPHPFTGVPAYLVIGEDFAVKAPWDEVREILLHEMVHVWQSVMGHHDKHGETFKWMCRRLNIPARAVD